MDHTRPLVAISDDELLRGLADLVRQSRRVESDLVAHIAEVELRRLFAREASPSMFVYCTQVLHLSESEAYSRITVARASLEHPMLLDMLADGRLHLTGVARLAPHLTAENRAGLLARATHKSRRQVEELIAEIAPRPDVVALMRRLPAPRELSSRGGGQLCPDRVESSSLTSGSGWEGPAPTWPLAPAASASPFAASASAAASGSAASGSAASGSAASPSLQASALVHTGQPVVSSPAPAGARTSGAAVIQPLGNARYKVQFTASTQLHHKLERLRALMRLQVPDGDLAAIIDNAVSEKLERLEARRFAKSSRPRKSVKDSDTSPTTRHIPAAVRRAVHERDGGRCRYVDASGRRCSERDRLEYHHRHPFGMGGDHSPENIGLMCRAHNAFMAEHDYGRETAGLRSLARQPASVIAGPNVEIESRVVRPTHPRQLAVASSTSDYGPVAAAGASSA